MTYLTGKRFKTLDDGKTGVIVTEPFRVDDDVADFAMGVAVHWSDGSIQFCVDIESLKIIEEDIGYVVCLDWPEPGCETLIHETWWSKTTLDSAKIRADQERFKELFPRIGKVIFPFE